MKSKFVLCLVVWGVLSAGAAVAADDGTKARNAEAAPRTAPAAKSRQQSADKALLQAAQDAGMRTCRPLVDQVTRYLIGNNSKSAGMLFAAPNNANGRIASAAIEIESGQSVTYASANYAPYGETGCGVAYDAVTYWKESCNEVASNVLGSLKSEGTLGNRIAILDGGPAMRMYLMPAGSGCVQIKKEIVY